MGAAVRADFLQPHPGKRAGIDLSQAASSTGRKRGPVSRFLDLSDRLSRLTGSLSAWLTTVLVVVVCADVATRYLFDFTLVSVQESQWHVFALIFLIGAASTLAADRHVRVDVFFSRLSSRGRAWVDFTGTILLLIPFCVMAIYLGWRYAAASFAVLESSPQPGGLPARYLLKACLPIAFALLLIQGIGNGLRALRVLRSGGRRDGSRDSGRPR